MSQIVENAIRKVFVPHTRTVDAGQKLFDNGIFSLFGSGNDGRTVVTHHTALCLSAVWNAIDQISNDIAKLPKGVYEKQGDSRYRRPDHPVDYLISKRPHRLMTEFNFHKVLIVSALLRGNGVAVIKRNASTGVQQSFDFVRPNDLNDIKKVGDELVYYIKGYKPLTSEDVIHIPGFSFDGITGLNIFRFAAQNMGTALEADNFAADNFKSKGLVAGLLKTQKQLKSGAKIGLANAMEDRLSKKGTHNIGVLDEGMDWQSITANAQEAGLVDWKKVSIPDIARWFNIAPHKIKDLTNATYSNIEQQSIEHGMDTIQPWVRRIEQEYDYKLFSDAERISYYVKLNTNALIRTDIKTKGEYYSRAINFGWEMRNEVRAYEDLNPIEGLDQPLIPANTKTLEEVNKEFADGN